MLETTMSSQVLAANEVLGARMLAADEVGDVEGGGGSKREKPKTGRSESRKSAKGQNSSKSKKPSTLKHAFILLRLAFTDIWIEENDSLRCSNSRCRVFGLVQASRFGGPLSKAISRNQSEIVKRNSRVLYLLPLTMATVTLSSLILFLRSEIFQA